VRPLDLSPRSSDEYAPVPPSPVVVEAARRAREALHDLVRSRAVSRRDLFMSAAASAAVLSALSACSAAEKASTGTAPPGGSFVVPTTTDPAAASSVLDREGLVVDVQLHFLDPARNGSNFGGGFPQAACGASDPKLCFTQDTFLDLVFAQSDTQVGVLSGLPFAGKDSPLAVDVMEHARERLAQQANGRRLLLQAGAFPATGPLQAALDQMASDAATYPVAAWKTYTHAPTSYRLDDERGDALLSQAVALGIPILAVHKGIAGGDPSASPADIGPAAAAHPDATLVVYHSGWEPDEPEAAYRADLPAEQQRGVDRLVTSLRGAGIGPGGNVYAELGSTWFNLTRDLDAAAHVLGKLLVQLGPERILWGTDSIWYGSPQGQIDAFRAFTISEAFQEQFGYPALTDETKAMILGGNAARLYAIS
jgi:predicted TIM-barrel fold metal-dependent hydrolase